ncbi:MAG: FAD-dependent oxidoreductase [Propionibacteriaceae bacterium]|nr:FAD-dependent oxidoreductase [Propionibacteriaceae bacterium]
MSRFTFDTEYDLVVIGGGASGKMAAYIGAKEGGLNVALLEKMEETGGTSRYAEGQAAFNSSEQLARKVPPQYTGTAFDHYPTYAEGFARYMDYSHQRANPDVVRTQVYNTAETIDIMKDLGIVYSDVMIYAFYQQNELNTFHRPEGLGEHMQEVLLRATINAGVDIFTSTQAKKILMEDGKVVGVQALDRNSGAKLVIGAKAVVIATGGFGNNPEMVRRYAWQYRNADFTFQFTPTENTGDGLNMAVHVGADVDSLGALMNSPCARGKDPASHVSGGALQPNLWVNKSGLRFCTEEVAFSFINAGSSIIKQPECTAYAILDSAMIQRYMEEGSDIGLGDFIAYKQKLTRLATELEQDVADGVGWKADTPEELAAAIGDIDQEQFVKTFNSYNEYCAKADDPDFFKQAEWLRPLSQAPFYAIEMTSSVLVSCGGIRVNGDMQVTDKDYKPIPGLYAVGMDASGLYGDTYNLDVPGTANGFAHMSGRVAARHVIATLKG